MWIEYGSFAYHSHKQCLDSNRIGIYDGFPISSKISQVLKNVLIIHHMYSGHKIRIIFYLYLSINSKNFTCISLLLHNFQRQHMIILLLFEGEYLLMISPNHRDKFVIHHHEREHKIYEAQYILSTIGVHDR